MAHRELSAVALAAKRPKDAVTEARAAVTILDGLPSPQPLRTEEALVALGLALHAQGSPTEAITPLDPSAKFSLAMVYVEMGHPAWAQPVLQSLATGQTITQVYTVTVSDVPASDPPLKMVRVDCTWSLLSRGPFTNTVFALRSQEQ
jgi:hypothetical protein